MERPELAGLRVLVVDDNGTNRRILQGMLSKWGMRSTLAESAIAALECAKQAESPFALILADFNMPDMDGFALVEQLRRGPDLAVAAKVIMLTSAGKARRWSALPGAGRGGLPHQTRRPVGVV